jgi:putative transposase
VFPAGPDGLLKQLTKTVLETALNQELTEHLGHEKHGRPDPGSGNICNGTRARRCDGRRRGPARA